MRAILLALLCAGVGVALAIGGHGALTTLADTETVLAPPAQSTCSLCHGAGIGAGAE